MRSALLELTNNVFLVDTLMASCEDGIVNFPVKGGVLKITYECIAETNEKRSLTRNEIIDYLSDIRSKITVDDAVKILEEMRECDKNLNDNKLSINSQYYALSKSTNPIYMFEAIGKECPAWYKEKYEVKQQRIN